MVASRQCSSTLHLFFFTLLDQSVRVLEALAVHILGLHSTDASSIEKALIFGLNCENSIVIIK